MEVEQELGAEWIARKEGLEEQTLVDRVETPEEKDKHQQTLESRKNRKNVE